MEEKVDEKRARCEDDERMAQIKNQLGSGGGAEQRHERPPDSLCPTKLSSRRSASSAGPGGATDAPPGSQGPTTISPPSAIALKDSPILSVGVTVYSATGGTVTGTFLSTFSVVSTPGSAASAAKHDETSMKSLAPHTLNLPYTSLACAGAQKKCL